MSPLPTLAPVQMPFYISKWLVEFSGFLGCWNDNCVCGEKHVKLCAKRLDAAKTFRGKNASPISGISMF